MGTKPKKPKKTEVIIIRVTDKERLEIELNAVMFGDGKLSEWIRTAALKYQGG